MGKSKLKNLPDLSDLAHVGAEITVKVTPKAARAGITRDGERIRIQVNEPPENGKANAAVQSLLAAALGIAPSRLVLKRGQSARIKAFVVLEV
jgi:uncharacterized protein YggU (UPF0235/DUF167 family)